MSGGVAPEIVFRRDWGDATCWEGCWSPAELERNRDFKSCMGFLGDLLGFCVGAISSCECWCLPVDGRLSVLGGIDVFDKVLNSAAAALDSGLSCSMTAPSNFWDSFASLLSRLTPRACHRSPSPQMKTSSFRLILNDRHNRLSSSKSRIWIMCFAESDSASADGERRLSSAKQTAGRWIKDRTT